MAKERLGLKDSLGLSPKVRVKKTDVDVEKTEKAVKEIHTDRPELTRISVDMDKALFKKMKIKVAQDGITVRDYVLSLIEANLSK